MIKSIRLFFIFIFALPIQLMSQSIQANWQCTSAIVEYTHVAREFESPQDSANGSYSVTASWPSSAAAAAGMGYTHTLKEYAIGDTVIVNLVPLINETLLAMAGVSMNVDLNDDGINELIIFNNDQGNKSAKLNIFQIQNSNGILINEQLHYLRGCKDTIEYLMTGKLPNDGNHDGMKHHKPKSKRHNDLGSLD